MFDKHEYQGTPAEALAMVAALLKQGRHLSIQVVSDLGGISPVRVRVNECKASSLPQPSRWRPFIAPRDTQLGVQAMAEAGVAARRAEIRALAAEAKRTGTKVRAAGRQS